MDYEYVSMSDDSTKGALALEKCRIVFPLRGLQLIVSAWNGLATAQGPCATQLFFAAGLVVPKPRHEDSPHGPSTDGA